MPMNPFSWFAGNLLKMPKWVQVITWFVMLFLTCYLYIAPRFVNGHAVIRTEDGGVLDYRGATLRTHIEGRVLKFKSNEDGYWSVPVVSHMPQDMRLELYHEDKGAWFEVRIGSGDIWKNAFGAAEVRMIVNDGDQPVRVELVRSGSGGLLARIARGIASVISTPVYAQSRFDRAVIVQQTIAATAAAVKRKPSQVTVNYRLSGKNAPTYVQKLKIIGTLEKKFDIVIPDEKWRQMEKVDDLVKYIESRTR